MMEAATRATREKGMRAFTLNLSAEVERQALANAKGPITCMHDRIDKAIKRMLHCGLEFAFRPEFTVDGRLHLHGIIEVPSCQEVRVSRALAVAGGTWTSARPEFQLDVRDLFDGDGWSGYCDKSATRVVRAWFPGPLMRSLRRLREVSNHTWGTVRFALD